MNSSDPAAPKRKPRRRGRRGGKNVKNKAAAGSGPPSGDPVPHGAPKAKARRRRRRKRGGVTAPRQARPGPLLLEPGPDDAPEASFSCESLPSSDVVAQPDVRAKVCVSVVGRKPTGGISPPPARVGCGTVASGLLTETGKGFRRNARHSVPLLFTNSVLADKITERGYKKVRVVSKTTNAHQDQASVRKFFTVEMLCNAGRSTKILAPFDFGRLAGLARTIGGGLKIYHMGRPTTAKDLARLENASDYQVWSEQPVDIFMLNDTYMCPSGRITAAWLASLCKLTSRKQGFLTVTPFSGAAGVAMGQLWVRNREDQVVCSPDHSSQYTHFDMNWILEDSVFRVPGGYLVVADRLALECENPLGVKHILSVTFVTRPLVNSTRRLSDKYTLVARIKEEGGHFIRSNLWGLGKYVYLAEYCDLRVKMLGRVDRPHLQASAQHHLTERLQASQVYLRFKEQYPVLASEVFATTLEALRFFRAKETEALRINRINFGKTLVQHEALLKETSASNGEAVLHALGWAFKLSFHALASVAKAPLLLIPEVKPQGEDLWERYSSDFNNFLFDDTLSLEGMACGFRNNMLTRYPTCVMYGSEKPQDPNVTVKSSVLMSREAPAAMEPIKRDMLAILVVSGTMPAPTASVNSLLGALRMRNQVLVPSAKVGLWMESAVTFCESLRLSEHFDAEPLEPLPVEDWLAGISDAGKRKKFEAAVEAYDSLSDYHTVRYLDQTCVAVAAKAKLGMFPKSNETLFPKHVDGEIGMKPRTIITVPDQVQIVAQPYIQRIPSILKRLLDTTVFPGNGRRSLHLTYSGGMRAEDLTVWMREAHERIATTDSFLFQGDDSVGVVMLDGMIVYFEIDYSHFDQSQKEDQIEAETVILIQLGVPRSVALMLKKISARTATYQKDNKGIVVRYSTTHPKRLTGSPQTSVCNSLNNMLAVMMFAQAGFDQGAWEDIGLTAKLMTHSSREQVTFLRGVWWKLRDVTPVVLRDGTTHFVEYAWGWMPSSVAKLGKMLRPMRKRETLESLAHAISRNISPDRVDVPILRAFQRALQRLGGRTQPAELPGEQYRPGFAGFKLDVKSSEAFMLYRYNLLPSAVSAAEALFDSVTALPALVCHDAISRTVIVDYS